MPNQNLELVLPSEPAICLNLVRMQQDTWEETVLWGDLTPEEQHVLEKFEIVENEINVQALKIIDKLIEHSC